MSEITKETIVEDVLYKGETKSYNLKELCEILSVDCDEVIEYDREHPESGIKNSITWCGGACYVNIFGKLVIPDEEEL